MKKSLLFITTCLLLSGSMHSQVTIGSAEKPSSGALLDLKEKNNPVGDEGKENASKGLGLPRVELTDLKKLTMGTNVIADGSIAGGGTVWEAHAGLMVYNVAEGDVCDFNSVPLGLHVWDGTTWVGLGLGMDKTLSSGVYKLTDPRDGEVYLVGNFGVTAGDWMLENLRYIPAVADGFVHSAASSRAGKHYAYPEAQDASTAGYTYVPNDHPFADWESNKIKGLLYNWAAATNGENSSIVNQGQNETNEQVVGERGICPPDWHLPSDKEWNDLEREIYNNAHLYSSYTEDEKNTWTPWLPIWESGTTSPGRGWRPTGNPVDAQARAMNSPCRVTNPSGIEVSRGKSLSTEAGGFSILRVGNGSNGSLVNTGLVWYMWSSSSSNAANAWLRLAGIDYGAISRTNTNSNREYLSSVRCKKNTN